MMDKIELATLANGGEKHRKEWCRCDPDVGAEPCEYCAIFDGLNYARKALAEVKAERDKYKKLSEFRRRVIKRPCIHCGYKPKMIKAMESSSKEASE